MKKKTLTAVILSAMVLTALSSCQAPAQSQVTETDASESSVTEVTTTTEESIATTAYTTTESTALEPAPGMDYYVFGHYEQDGDEDNGPEPIEWVILTEEDGRLFLTSRYILDYQAYNIDYEDVTWETCSLREWLNNDFYNAAFDDEEKERVLTVINSNPDNNGYWATEGGNDTEDRVFLLSYDEAATYFADDEARATGPCDWWWLRSPGRDPIHASIALFDGELMGPGHVVTFNYHDHGVRPAIWISVDP